MLVFSGAKYNEARLILAFSGAGYDKNHFLSNRTKNEMYFPVTANVLVSTQKYCTGHKSKHLSITINARSLSWTVSSSLVVTLTPNGPLALRVFARQLLPTHIHHCARFRFDENSVACVTSSPTFSAHPSTTILCLDHKRR